METTSSTRLAVRLMICVVSVLGALGLIWVLGELGFRQGFASLLRLRSLLTDQGGGLATGADMLVSMPRVIIAAGVVAPVWLMLGFLLVALPAAGLGAARPTASVDGNATGSAFACAGAVGAMIVSGVLVWWTTATSRLGRLVELPFAAADAANWLRDLQTAAGLDVIALLIALVWSVLVLRLPIATWLRALAATASFFALAVVTVAMAHSNATVAEVRAPRSVVFVEDGSLGPQIIIGYTPGQVATLRADDGSVLIELHDPRIRMTVIARESIVDFLDDD